MELRPYQITLSDQAKILLEKHRIAYIAGAMRTWKTITAFETIKKFWSKRILFATKKKAISSIEKDYSHFSEHFYCKVSTYQSLHKIEEEFDILVLDEVHSLISWFPKPSATNKLIKKRWSKLPMIFLSWTPFVESASKIYPQFSVSDYSPLKNFRNFYDWHRRFWIQKQIKTSYGWCQDYSEVKYDEAIKPVEHLILTQSQKDSWFISSISEHILEVEMKPTTYDICKKLIKDRVIEGRQWTILADTWVRLQLTLHQLFSGTVILDEWIPITLDDSKAQFIKKYFKWKKIAILTCFKQEIVLLKEVLGDLLTEDLQVFNDNNNKWYVGNVISNREGVSLKAADALVFYNLPFSWVSWIQWKERLNYLGREENNVYIICAKAWLERKILKALKNKQNFTNKIFEKDLYTLF